MTTKEVGVTASKPTTSKEEVQTKEVGGVLWDGSEITYFRMLHPIFINNFCAIAELLRTKTCLEVFEHAQCVAGETGVGKLGSRDRRLAAKKKKKSMRLVSGISVTVLDVDGCGEGWGRVTRPPGG